MRLEATDRENHFRIKIGEEWTLKYKAEILQLMEFALFMGQKTIALDFKDCVDVRISMVGMLSALCRECAAEGCRLVLLNPPDDLRVILEEAKLDRLIDIFDCEEAMELAA